MSGGRQRGMALIQALVIVAAIAAVATALMQRSERARLRLLARGEADQAALYVDGGVDLLRALLAALPTEEPVHPEQDWAQPREGLRIDRGTLAYTVEDLSGRLNVNGLSGGGPAPLAARAAFLRLAADMGVSRRAAERMAAALGADPGDAGAPLPLPLVDPRQLAPLAADRADAFADLLPFLAALPAGSEMNANTLRAELWSALLPDLSRASREALMRRLADAPVATLDDLVLWADEALPPGTAEALAELPLTGTSTLFVARVEARLDSVVLRRSVVLDRDGPNGSVAVLLSMPETE